MLLIAALVRTAFSHGASSPSLALRMTAMVLFLIADLGYNAVAVAGTGTREPGNQRR